MIEIPFNVEGEVFYFELDDDYMSDNETIDFLKSFAKNKTSKYILENALKLQKIFLRKNVINDDLIDELETDNEELDINSKFIEKFFEYYFDKPEFAFGVFYWYLNENPYDDIVLQNLPSEMNEGKTYSNGAEYEIDNTEIAIGDWDYFIGELKEYYESMFDTDVNYLDSDSYNYYSDLLENYSNLEEVIKDFWIEDTENYFNDMMDNPASDECYINELHEFLYNEGLLEETCCDDDLEEYKDKVEDLDEYDEEDIDDVLREKCKEHIEKKIEENFDEYVEQYAQNKIEDGPEEVFLNLGYEILSKWYDDGRLIIDFEKYAKDNPDFGRLNNYDEQYFEIEYTFNDETFNYYLIRRG